MSFFTRGGAFAGRDGGFTRKGALGRSLTLPKGGVVLINGLLVLNNRLVVMSGSQSDRPLKLGSN